MALTITVSDGTLTAMASNVYCENFGLDNPGVGVEVASDQHGIWWVGGNSTVDANQKLLNLLFEKAWERYNSGTGVRIWVYYNLDGVIWRGEVINGKIENTPNIVKYERALGERESTVTIQRYNWLEGDEARLTMTNANGTDQNSLYISNNNDHVTGAGLGMMLNYFDIVSTKIDGDLPARCRLEIQGGNSTQTKKLWIDVGKTPLSLPADVLASASHWVDNILGTPTAGALTTGDATASNSDYWSGGALTSNAVSTATNSFPSYFNAFASQGFYRAFVALQSSVASQLKLTPYSGNYLALGNPIGNDTYITPNTAAWSLYDLGLVSWPFEYVSGKVWQARLALKFESAGAVTVKIDAINSPRADCERIYTNTNSTPWNASQNLIDDGLDAEQAYIFTPGTGATDYIQQPVGDFITLTPGMNHRFVFNMINDLTTLAHVKLDSTSRLYPSIYYRPRRLTI